MASKDFIDSTDSDLDITRQESMVTNMFGRDQIPFKDKLRKRNKWFDIKVKIFCALHKPTARIAKFYHFLVLIIIFFSVIALNIIDEEMSNESDKSDSQKFNTEITFVKILMDTAITIILCVEIILRFWSCDVIHDYKGIKGGINYLKTYAFWRLLDVLGIISFVIFIANHVYVKDYDIDENIRITHLLQVFQIHRLMYRYLKVIIETIKSQMNQLIIVLIFAFLTLILTAFCVYLCERDSNPSINRFFDAFWMTFVTFSTIGYGDIVPFTWIGRLLIMVCASFGFVFFALPGSILGTGLALQIQEEQKRSEYYRTPASRLIQSVWRSYASNQRSKSDAHWKLYKRKDGEPLTAQDRACIRFIRSVAYLKQRHRFKVIIGLVNDDFFRERTTRELSRRLQRVELDIKYLNDNLNRTLRKKFQTRQTLDKLILKIREIKDKKELDTEDTITKQKTDAKSGESNETDDKNE